MGSCDLCNARDVEVYNSGGGVMTCVNENACLGRQQRAAARGR